MLKPGIKLALYMEGAFAENTGKMGLGVLRYSPNPIVSIVDSMSVGRSCREVTGLAKDVPIVATVEESVRLGAEVLVLGIAPPGGRIPNSWQPVIDHAIRAGLSIVNGLHDRIKYSKANLLPNQFVWEVREEPEGLVPGTGAARNLTNKRVLTIGTDMAVGKMTAGLELLRALRVKNVDTAFVATGQIGMVITGSGVPLDAIRLDFAPGAIEREVMAVPGADVVLIEGQGSLIHPGSSANLPLIRGSCPTHLLLCHRARMPHLVRNPWVTVPPLPAVVRMYQDLAELGGNLIRPVCLGVCLNTSELDIQEAQEAIRQLADETGYLVTDPVRFGMDEIVARLVA